MTYEFSIATLPALCFRDDCERPHSSQWTRILRKVRCSPRKRLYVPMWRRVSDTLDEGTLCVPGKLGAADEVVCRVYRQAVS